MDLAVHYLALLLCLLSVSADAEQFYPLPNPFSPNANGFYHVKSNQIFMVDSRNVGMHECDEYTSLSRGLTFSRRTSVTDKSSTLLVISDGLQGKTYIVRNPDHGDIESIDCELDHVHSYRHIFPWQYEYDLPRSDDKRHNREDRRNKNETDDSATVRSSIYGVAAIWLNAAAKSATKELVDSAKSKFERTWDMRGNHLKVTLSFQVPSKDGEIDVSAIDTSRIQTIGIAQDYTINRENLKAVREQIVVDTFEAGVLEAGNESLGRYLQQLDQCRELNVHHRIFPSLVKGMNLSPDRAYSIEYIMTRHPALDERSLNKFDVQRHRFIAEAEYVSEFLSYKLEIQTITYEDDPKNQKQPERIDTFMRQFTARESSRSSRHAYQDYHIIEVGGRLECIPNERELLPGRRFHLLTRPIYFHRDTGDIVLSGVMRGLGALLMNVAERHYKHFVSWSVSQKYVDHKGNDSGVKYDHWRIDDTTNDVTYLFQFDTKPGDGVVDDITRLAYVTISSSGHQLMTFEITKFELEIEPDEQDLVFKPPSECFSDSPNTDKKQDEDIDPNSDFFYDEDSENKTNENSDELQLINGELELNSGDMIEFDHVPSFYDYMETHSSYKMISQIQMEGDQSRKIFLRETYSTDNQMMQLAVFKSESDISLNRPMKEVYVDYKDEFIFSVDQASRCELADEIDPWLRLLSSPYTHYIRSKLRQNLEGGNLELVTSASSSLRFYGVAALWQWATSDQFNAEFKGMKEPERSTNGNLYREILWSIAEGGETDVQYEFTFLFDETKSQESKKLKIHLPLGELIHLKSIRTIAPTRWDKRSSKSVDSRFRMASIDVKELLRANKFEVTLPQSCSRARSRADIERQKRDYDLVKESSMMSLTSLMELDNASKYLAHYEVKGNSSGAFYYEMFDLSANKGYIQARSRNGDRSLNYYFDNNRRISFQESSASSDCQKVDKFRFFGPFGLLMESYINLNRGPEEEAGFYGLGAIWNQLSSSGHFRLERRLEHGNSGGHYYQTKSYTATLKRPTSSEAMDVIFTFSSGLRSVHPDDKHIMSDSPFRLTTVQFVLRPVRHERKRLLASISVDSITYSGQVLIPRRCYDSIDNPEPQKTDSGLEHQPETTPVPNNPFPKIEEHIKESLFHMRSEIVVSRNGVGVPSSYLLDEWVGRGTVRIKSKNLDDDIDLMIFEETKELYDISKPYECGRSQPKPVFLPQVEGELNLFEFWAGRVSSTPDPALLYYAPVALWLLAERNQISTVKVKETRSTTDSNNSQLNSAPRKVGTEIWRLSSDQNNLSKPKWSYELEFDRVTLEDRSQSGPVKEWHLLNSITIDSADSHGDKHTITIDIINYKFDHMEAEVIDLFKLPNGYGCYRGDLHDNRFRLKHEIDTISLLVGGRISFEATMEYQPPPQRDSYKLRTILPTVSGSLISLPHGEGPGIQAQYSRVRNLDGTFEAIKRVYDPASSLLYLIDRSNGYCKIQLTDSYIPRIEFPMAGYQTEALYLNEHNLNILLGNVIRYQKVNDYSFDGIRFTTYEAKTDNLYMGSPRHQVAATIVRTFAYKETDLRKSIRVHDGSALHESVGIKVIILDPRTSHNLKTLSISFNLKVTDDSYNLPTILRELSVAQCYNDGDSQWEYTSEQFTVEYQLTSMQYYTSIMHSRRLESSLYAALIAHADVHPLQLDGKIQVEFAPDYLVRYNFNLLAPATAYLRFQELMERKMGTASRSVAETRLLSSIVKCSKWCDEHNCITMSYCSDMTCRILPSKHSTLKEASTDFYNNFLVDTRCSFYRGPQISPPSLSSFEQSMNRIINEERNKHELDKFALKDFFDIVPTKFFGSRKKFDFVDEDIDDYDSTRQNQIVFQTVPGQLKLDAAQLSGFNDGRKNQVQSTPSHQKTYGDCLNQCKDDCVAISYCRDNSECQALTGRADVKKMIDAIGDPIKDCQAALRDYTLEFDRIQNVTMPTKYSKRLDEYSTVECAAACKDDEDCLSFESCTLTMDRNLNLPNQVCLLQKSHMAQESIFSDRSADPDAVFYICDHFSRAVIYDYLKISDSQLKAKHRGVVRGLNVDKCALDCETDEECRAFEYCYDPEQMPTQSCYFVKSPDILDTSSMSKTSLASQLDSSKYCSMYVLDGGRANPMMAVAPQYSSYSASIIKILLYVLCSMSIGYLIQTLAIRYVGRSILFS